MLTLSPTPSQFQVSRSEPRRSDRKRTKKIFKEDFFITSSSKYKPKRHQLIRLHQNLVSQTNKQPVKFYHHTNKLWNLDRSHNEVTALRQMKQAVNEQQIKYSELFQIKLFHSTNKTKQNIFHLNKQKIQNDFNTLNLEHKVYQTIQREDFFNSENEFDKVFERMSTSDDVYLHFQSQKIMHSQNLENEISLFNSDCFPETIGMPPRKQSASLLSDNYESSQLFDTIDNLKPGWHHQEFIINEQQYLS